MDMITVTVSKRDMEAFAQITDPKEFARVCRQALNDMAFEFKKLAPAVIGSKYTIRNPRFVSSRFRVEKATSLDLASMRSVAYSVESERFSGWTESLGAPTSRLRLINLAARKGDVKQQAMKSARLMSGQAYPHSKDYTSIPAMVSMIARSQTPGRPFIITGGKWVPGLYRIQPRKGYTARTWSESHAKKAQRQARKRWPKVQRVQTFGKPTKPRERFDWPLITAQRVQSAEARIWMGAFSKIKDR
jgi:hypothetical protein